MSQRMKTLKNTSYFAKGTYKNQVIQYMKQYGLIYLCARTFLAPLQRWKLIQQTQICYPSHTKKFINLYEYLTRATKEQGHTSFWRGNIVSCYVYIWQIFVQLTLYDSIHHQINLHVTEIGPQNRLYIIPLQRVLMPAIASFLSLLVLYPLDTLRVRLTMSYHKDRLQRRFSGMGTFLGYIKQAEGSYFKIYRGFWFANVISLIQINLYIELNKAFENNLRNKLELSHMWTPNLIISTALLAMIHPLDTVKRVLQLNNMSKPVLFNNIRAVFSYYGASPQIINSYRALFNGLSASIMKNILIGPLIFGLSRLKHTYQGVSE